MGLKDYRNQIQTLIDKFENMNFSFEELKAKIPEDRTKGGNGGFFDSLKDDIETLKTSIADFRDLMETEGKEKKAEELLFEIIKPQLNVIEKKQVIFQDFLREKNFEELNIPEMNAVYDIFRTAHAGIGLCNNIDGMSKLDEVKASMLTYSNARKEYKDLEELIIKKYQGQNLRELLVGGDNLFDEIFKKDLKLGTENKVKEGMQKKLDEKRKELETVSNSLSETEEHVARFEKYIETIDEYRKKLEDAKGEYEGAEDTIKKEIAERQKYHGELLVEYDKHNTDYNSSLNKLLDAQADIQYTSYIENKIGMADCDVLSSYLASYLTGNESNIKFGDLSDEVKVIIKRRELGIGPDSTVEEILAAVTAKRAEIAVKLSAAEGNPTIDDAAAEYTERAIQVLNTKRQIDQAAAQISLANDQLQKNKEAYENKVKEYYNDYKTAGVLKNGKQGMAEGKDSQAESEVNTEEQLQNREEVNENVLAGYNDDYAATGAKPDVLEFEKLNPLDLDRYLAEKKAVYQKAKAINEQKKEVLGNTKETLKTEFDNLDNENKAEALKVQEMTDELDKLNSVLPGKNDIQRELNALLKKRNAAKSARQAAVETYAKNREGIIKGDIDSLVEFAKMQYARVDDAKNNHQNSDEFKAMSATLRELSEMESENRADYVVKLQELKENAQIYKDAKMAQFRPFESTLRKTRLKFADDLINAVDERITLMRLEAAEELERIEGLLGENGTLKRKTEKKAKTDMAYYSKLNQKTMPEEAKPEEMKKDEVPPLDIINDIEKEDDEMDFSAH